MELILITMNFSLHNLKHKKQLLWKEAKASYFIIMKHGNRSKHERNKELTNGERFTLH